MSGRHPDDDLLADLAADVLPTDEARAVEAHVLGCARCADLLADAERVRQLLMSEDPGPMPASVLERIEVALQAEARHGAAAPGAPAGSVPWETSVTGHVIRPAFEQPPAAAAAPAAHGYAPGAWEDETGVWDAPSSWGRSGSTAAPSTRPGDARSGATGSTGVGRARAQGSRRDLRDGGDRRRWRGVPGRGLLAAAAGAVLIAGVGSVAVSQLGSGSGSSTAGQAALESQGAASSAEAGALSASGRVYTEKDFSTQVQSLLKTARLVAPRQVTRSATSSAGKAPDAAVEGGAQDLQNPERLAACLAALGAPGKTPLVVDIARYQQREAAVIVLPGRGGGYEAWAVSPDCGIEGDAGTLTYAVLDR